MFLPEKMNGLGASDRYLIRVQSFFACCAYVAYFRALNKAYFVTMLTQTQTEVDVLSVKKEVQIKSAHGFIGLTANEHTGADHPGDLSWQIGEVGASAGFAGIIFVWRSLGPAIGREIGSSGHPPASVPLQCTAKAGQGLRTNQLGVRIEKINELTLAGGKGLIASSTEAEVFRILDQANGRVRHSYDWRGGIRAGVVHYNDLAPNILLSAHGLEAVSYAGSRLKSNDDNTNIDFVHHGCWA